MCFFTSKDKESLEERVSISLYKNAEYSTDLKTTNIVEIVTCKGKKSAST